MIKAILVDDERHNIDNLSVLLQQHYPELKILATANSVASARQEMLEHQPNLIFLDIQMPEQNGFELLKQQYPFPFEVIFVTAHDQYALQAIKFSALDYLLKPIDEQELKTAVSKATLKLKHNSGKEQVENLLELLHRSQQKEAHRIVLPTADETRFLRPNQILYCESENNYTKFFLETGEKLLISKPIYEYEEMLQDYGFIRCHQSYLVNKHHVKSMIKKDGGYLELYNTTIIPVSRTKKEEVKKKLN